MSSFLKVSGNELRALASENLINTFGVVALLLKPLFFRTTQGQIEFNEQELEEKVEKL